MYHYAGNNPVKYVDPDGRFSINIGLQGQTGAGVGGNLETGIKIAFSWKKGFSFGIYSSQSLGAEFGVSAFAGGVVGINFREKEVKTGISQSVIVGVSAEEVIGGGIDISYDLDDKKLDVSSSKGFGGFSLKAGVGANATVAEGHLLYNVTETISGKDLYETFISPIVTPVLDKIASKINDFENSIENYFMEQMEMAYDY